MLDDSARMLGLVMFAAIVAAVGFVVGVLVGCQ